MLPKRLLPTFIQFLALTAIVVHLKEARMLFLFV